MKDLALWERFRIVGVAEDSFVSSLCLRIVCELLQRGMFFVTSVSLSLCAAKDCYCLWLFLFLFGGLYALFLCMKMLTDESSCSVKGAISWRRNTQRWDEKRWEVTSWYNMRCGEKWQDDKTREDKERKWFKMRWGEKWWQDTNWKFGW